MSEDKLIEIITYIFQFIFLVCSFYSVYWCYLYRSIGWLSFANNCMSDKCKSEMYMEREQLMPVFKVFVIVRIFVLLMTVMFSFLVHKWQYVIGTIVAMSILYVYCDIKANGYSCAYKNKYDKMSDLVLDGFMANYLTISYRYMLISNLIYSIVFFSWFIFCYENCSKMIWIIK